MLGQEADEGKANELSAIPALIDRLAVNGGLKGALVSIDAIATNAKIAQTIRQAGGDYLLAVKANQPSLRAQTQDAFAVAAVLDVFVDYDKGHGRIEQRTVDVIHEVDWLDGDRRFPGEFRLPGAATIIRVRSRVELADRYVRAAGDRRHTQPFDPSASVLVPLSQNRRKPLSRALTRSRQSPPWRRPTCELSGRAASVAKRQT